MSITERHQALGDWTVALKSTTPPSVLRSIDDAWFRQILVTPTRLADLDPDTAYDAARYCGVLRSRPDYFTLRGSGQALWLADEDGKGSLIEAAATLTAGTFTQWVTALCPPSLTLGSTGTVSGTLTQTFQYTNRRAALDFVCAYFGAEWRIRNGVLDAGYSTDLFRQGEAIAVRREGGRQGNIRGLHSDAMAVAADVEDYTTRVVVLAGDLDVAPSVGGADLGSIPYTDPNGNDLVMTRLIEARDAQPGSEITLATMQLGRFDSPTRAVTVSLDEYDVAGSVAVGDLLHVFDLERGLFDVDAEPFPYRGDPVLPVLIRVEGMQWPVTEGQGVYLRSSTELVDLTDWVEWETGSAKLTVGVGAKSIAGGTKGFDRPAWLTMKAQAEAFVTVTFSPAVADATDSGTFTDWVNCGNIEVPEWATEAHVECTLSGIYDNAVGNLPYALRVRIGTNDGSTHNVNGTGNGLRFAVPLGTDVTLTSTGTKAFKIQAKKNAGTGDGKKFRADTSSLVTAQIRFTP